ncbi:MAG: hypothetical protein ABI528_05575 [bacterium]
MKKLFLLISFIILTGNLYSQDLKFKNKLSDLSLNDHKDRKHREKNSLKKGMWSVQFAISENFTLSSFDGAAISVKRHFSKHIALRLEFDGSYYKDEDDQSRFYNEGKSVGFNLILMYYLHTREKFSAYGYLGGNYNYNSLLSMENLNGTESLRRTVSGGSVIGAGAEYFIFRKFSLFAEYSYRFNFGNEKIIQQSYFPPYTRIEQGFKFTRFERNALKFGASVYF